MRTLLRLLLLACVASLTALSVGCEPVPDDDDVTSIEDCPEDQLYYAEACDQTYCGEPKVHVGTGVTAFEAVEENEQVPIWYGSQGGYHLDITVEMLNLCPIVFLRPYFEVVPNDGSEPYEVFSQNRHVQAVRVEPDVSPRQHFWGIRAFIPCEHWPDDPNHDLDCPEGRGSAGHLETFDAIIGVEAWDHNMLDDDVTPARYGSDRRTVDPYCCEG